MIDVHQLRKGTTFTLDGDLYKVIEFQHHKPGRGKAVIRTKIRNLRTGATLDKNFISDDRVDDIRIDRIAVQFLYHDGDFYYFMNEETFEQILLPAAAPAIALAGLTIFSSVKKDRNPFVIFGSLAAEIYYKFLPDVGR